MQYHLEGQRPLFPLSEAYHPGATHTRALNNVGSIFQVDNSDYKVGNRI